MKLMNLLGIGEHAVNGSPVNWSWQRQIGRWFNTLQVANEPHVPIHGLMHRSLTQARFREHSEFVIHSGLQFGALPM